MLGHPETKGTKYPQTQKQTQTQTQKQTQTQTQIQIQIQIQIPPQESNSKAYSRLSKQLGSTTQSGSFSPMLAALKKSAEKLASVHSATLAKVIPLLHHLLLLPLLLLLLLLLLPLLLLISLLLLPFLPKSSLSPYLIHFCFSYFSLPLSLCST